MATPTPRRILVTSHCVLNQNAVVQPLARSAGMMKSAVDWITEEGFGVVQLPCPEFRFLGPTRAPMTFDEYNTPEFHASNRGLLGPIVAQLKLYQDNGYEIVGGLHVQGSPSCDPATGNWIADLLEAAEAAGVVIKDLWQLPETESGLFDPTDPASHFGNPEQRADGAVARGRLVHIGATIPVRPSDD